MLMQLIKKKKDRLYSFQPLKVSDTFLRNNWTKIKMHSFQSAETCYAKCLTVAPCLIFCFLLCNVAPQSYHKILKPNFELASHQDQAWVRGVACSLKAEFVYLKLLEANCTPYIHAPKTAAASFFFRTINTRSCLTG